MPRKKQSYQPPESERQFAALAEEAVKAFREENPDAYSELVKAFDGMSADLALLGHGKFHVSLSKGDLQIEPGMVRGPESTGRGAIAPETLLAIIEGKLTPLEAFFKGDLIARANSANLHLAYDYFVKFADAALRSKRLQDLMGRFREMARV